jgi:ankyrin repeat protein
LQVTKEIFLQALKETGKVVIILDGFDEISPDYSPKVTKLIKAITDKTTSKIWISSRFSNQKELEDMLGKFACTLQPFTQENRVQFLKQYWSQYTEISNQGNLEKFAEKLLSLFSQNLCDKDGEFAGIPLQIMMLGETFANSAKEYCSSEEFNLPEKFNLLDLFQKFWEKKCNIYMIEKSKKDTSNPNEKEEKKSYLKKHMTSALIYLFSQDELNGLQGAIKTKVMKNAKKFLKSGLAKQFGIIREMTDGKPHFVHRCFAEYFAAEWFTGHYRKCKEFISNVLYESTKEVTRNMFDRMLAKDSKIHGSVLSNDIHALMEILKTKTDINTLDKGGRRALHLAASYNSPCIKELLSFEDIDANKPDKVLKWTPLRYADRMKSWMAMDILLQNGANPDDIVLTKPNSGSQEWVQRALWECASEGHIKLLEFMLNCGIEVNAFVEVPDIFHEKFTLLHRASYCGQVEVVRLIVNRGADINIRDANNNTALHLAAESGRVDIIKLLLDEGMSVNLTNTNDSTPLHVSAKFGHLEATKTLVERGAAINNTNKIGVTPLMVAAHFGNLETFRYLTKEGADINIRNNKNYSALHYAAGSGCVDIIKLLLDKGISVNLPNKDKFTSLHVCAKFGQLDATKALVERGAAINNTNKDGVTPLMVAAKHGKLEIFRYLTEIGADINIHNAYNSTALHYVLESGSVDIIKFLLDKGMFVNLTNTGELTLLPFHGQFVKE